MFQDGSIHYSLNNLGITSCNKLYLRYSTSCGERDSQPFHEQPETFIYVLISTTVMYLPRALLLRTQHCRHIHSYWSGVFNLLKFDHIWMK